MQFTKEAYGMVEGIVGTYSIKEDLRNTSARTGVIKIGTNKGDMFVKMHNRLSRWHPEVYAYENWVPLLRDNTPKFVGKFNDGENYGIIMTALDGMTINEWKTTNKDDLAVAYFNAGKLLKQLHKNFTGDYFGIPTSTGEPLHHKVYTDATEYIVETLREFLGKGVSENLLGQKDRTLVEWCIREAGLFKENKPVPTNWDYSPNNWMLNVSGEFIGIIDFENMLWGVDFDSFGVIIERYTQDEPDLLQSFLEGYEFKNNEENKVKLKIISTKIAIADIVYGNDTGFKRAAVCGRKLLDNLTEG